MKRIILIMLVGLFIILAIAFVYGVSIDKIKIEKIKLEDGTTQYYIYRLSEITTDKKILEDKLKLEKEKESLQTILDNLEEDCSYCEYEKEIWKNIKECYLICEKDGSWLTESERIHFNQSIKDLEKEIWNLENLI